MRLTIIIILIFNVIISWAQIGLNSDTLSPHSIDTSEVGDISQNTYKAGYRPFIMGGALLGYGVIAQFNAGLKSLDRNIKYANDRYLGQRTRIDDYLQYAPAFSVYALDIMGLEAKHNVLDRTLVMASSHLLMGLTVQTMKHTVGVLRPDGSNTKSFPSGHTATAFVGAHILFKEYVDTNPWIGVAGYAAAIATGGLRVVNNKHWVSDVVAGAGIGILSAEVAYLLLPAMNSIWTGSSKWKYATLFPIISNRQYGLSISYKW